MSPATVISLKLYYSEYESLSLSLSLSKLRFRRVTQFSRVTQQKMGKAKLNSGLPDKHHALSTHMYPHIPNICVFLKVL